jgi:hypothetical protein
LTRIMAALAAAGTLLATARWGWKAGAGFLVGSILSGLNLLALKRLIDGLAGANSSARPILLGLRYFFLAGIAYGILKLTPISLIALLSGVFTFTLAVFVEAAIEIVYARK